MILSLISRKKISSEEIRKTLLRRFAQPYPYQEAMCAEADISFEVRDTGGVFEQALEVHLNGISDYGSIDFASFYANYFATEVVIPIAFPNPDIRLMVYPNRFYEGCKRVPDDPCNFVPLQNIEGVPAF